MADTDKLVETLRAKAMLLIQRERELYALRLGRQRMLAWLHAFHRLSVGSRWRSLNDLCREWTTVMIQELHFQTAAVYCHAGPAPLELLDGKSHHLLAERVELEAEALALLGKESAGLFNGDEEARAGARSLSRSLQLQRFLWFDFPLQSHGSVLLVAGVSRAVSASHAALLQDDLADFTMLGRHLSALLSNSALTTQLQELFDHMRQAIVTFDIQGRVGAVSSRQAKRIFERDELEGSSIRELLFGSAPPWDVDAAALDEWLELAFTTRVEAWERAEKYAPREAVLEKPNGERLALALEFHALAQVGVPSRLMLLATDISVERSLREAVRTHEAERARKLAVMRRVIAGGPQVFVSFLEAARERLSSCTRLLAAEAVLPTETIDDLFRQIHTVRGEARGFDLTDLEAATSAFEAELDQLRSLARGGGHDLDGQLRARLEHGVQGAHAALERECELLVAVSPLGAAVLDQTAVRRSLLRELSELVGARDDALGRIVQRLCAVPLGAVTAGLFESVPQWAALQGSQVELRTKGREVPIQPDLARVLPGVLAHLLRNAIAHGIEPPEERLALGKSAAGLVQISGEEDAGATRRQF
jgi:HPt (histidine-containing phosphotransfer) domain-containing protein/PAS domain-containing protein